MKQRAYAITAASVFLSCILFPLAAEDSEIRTNAQGGIFSSDTRFWFSVPDGQRLRLRVNGNETYRGAGPASSTLTARPGEDRSYELVAERRSPPPADELLESRAFVVRVDALPPPPVAVSAVQKEGGAEWTLSFSAEDRSRVFALVDADSFLSSHEDIPAPLVFSARKVEGLAWCVDGAGNVSAPTVFSFKPFALSIANPAEGSWANRQLLVVKSEGASEVLWTADGGDPLASGIPYSGPALIGATGPVTVKVAAKSPDGRVERRTVSYVCGSAEPPAAASLRSLELAPIAAPAAAAVPAGFRWDIGDAPLSPAGSADLQFEGGASIELRPMASFQRSVPLYLSEGKGVLRYIFTLGNPASSSGTSVQVPSDRAPGAFSPNVYVSGRARMALWTKQGGLVRYRWESSGLWSDAAGPIPVPVAGGKLDWLVDKGSSVEGPFSESFPPIAPEAAYPSALPEVSSDGVSSGPVVLSVPAGLSGVRFSLSADIPGAEARTIELANGGSYVADVCDGEQFSWSVSGGGSSLPLPVDRRPPPAPSIEAPDEGAWVRVLPFVRFASGERRIEAVAKWRTEDGRSGSYRLEDSGQLRSMKQGPVEYLIEARAVDEAGNAGVLASRRFVVDESTVYVSASAPSSGGDGSRALPFASLAEAISQAKTLGEARVWVSGPVSLEGRAMLFDGVTVEGGYSADWKKDGAASEIRMAAGAAFVSSGGSVALSALKLVESGLREAPLLSFEGGRVSLSGIATSVSAPGARAPVLSAGGGAAVEVRDSSLVGGAPAVEVRGAEVVLRDTLVTGTAGRSGRLVVFAASDARVELHSSRIDCGPSDPGRSASVAVGIDSAGGSLRLERSAVFVLADGMSSGLVSRGTELRISDSQVSSKSERYASAVSIEAGRASLSGGRFSAASADAVALIVNDSPSAEVKASSFTVSGTGVVRAVQVRGPFPDLEACRFAADGKAAGAEALAGDAPLPGSVRGSVFSGFPYLFNRSYDADSMKRFNARFAVKAAENKIETPGGM